MRERCAESKSVGTVMWSSRWRVTSPKTMRSAGAFFNLFTDNILIGILKAGREGKPPNRYVSIMKSSRTIIDPEVLRGAAAQAVAALKLLANEQRLLLLCQLSQGEMCVGELEECLDIHQPTLSQQLGVLRSEAVVSTRREGKNIFYSVADPALLEILAVLYRLYCPKEK